MPRPPALESLRHVVVLMLENRSFDHLLGYLPKDPARPVDGVWDAPKVPMNGGPARFPSRYKAGDEKAFRTDPDIPHEFADVQKQLGPRTPSTGLHPMDGFARVAGASSGSLGEPAIRCMDPLAHVPVLAALAKQFVLCDRWFSSVPGPTWPNRFFAHAGSSGGLADSPTTWESLRAQQLGLHAWTMPTVYRLLSARGLSWRIYEGDFAQSMALSDVRREKHNVRDYDAFADDVARGDLAAYTFIEPHYGILFGTATDQHPPHDVRHGEALLKQVYETLRDSPSWENTLLVVTWDEHGGFYDHVSPPAAPAPDDSRSTSPSFVFDRLGPRVPAVLISPWLSPAVDSTVYDHTSLLRFVCDHFGLAAKDLGHRVAAAKSFAREGSPYLLGAPRKDAPARLPSPAWGAQPESAIALEPADTGLNELQRSLVLLAASLDRDEALGDRLATAPVVPADPLRAAVYVSGVRARLRAGPVARVEAAVGGPESALASTFVAEGLVVTVGELRPLQESLPEALGPLRLIRPDIVMLHTFPGPEDLASVRTLREALPGVRLWVQAPSNLLAAGTESRAVARVRGWVSAARELGFEVLSFNGEGASGAGRSGWKPGQPLTAEGIAQRAKAVIAAAREASGGALELAWSSHDMPKMHRLPWKEILGATGVAVNLPQVYPAVKGRAVEVAEARGRYERSVAQHAELVARGVIDASVAPGGRGWAPYTQAHGLTPGAACWIHDQAKLSAAWTLPEGLDANGLLALRAAAELRRRAGHDPGRVKRFQKAQGLKADGVVGAKTLAALGVG